MTSACTITRCASSTATRARRRRHGCSSSRARAHSAGPPSAARATSSRRPSSRWWTPWSTSSPDRLSKNREAARQEIPEPLRRDVRLLGGLLGGVIADYGGPGLLPHLEKLLRVVIRPPPAGPYERP